MVPRLARQSSESLNVAPPAESNTTGTERGNTNSNSEKTSTTFTADPGDLKFIRMKRSAKIKVYKDFSVLHRVDPKANAKIVSEEVTFRVEEKTNDFKRLRYTDRVVKTPEGLKTIKTNKFLGASLNDPSQREFLKAVVDAWGENWKEKIIGE